MGKQAEKLSLSFLSTASRRSDSLGGPVPDSRTLPVVLAAVVNQHVAAAAGDKDQMLCLCAVAKPTL